MPFACTISLTPSIRNYLDKCMRNMVYIYYWVTSWESTPSAQEPAGSKVRTTTTPRIRRICWKVCGGW